MGRAFDELSGLVIEAAIEVHRELGPGYLESIYENALVIALQQRGLVVQQQVLIEIPFRGNVVGTHRLDLLVENGSERLVIENKAAKAFEDIHFATVRSYLKATKIGVGLLLNFNAVTLQIKRVVLDYRDPE